MYSTKPTDASRVRAKFLEFLNHRHPQKESLWKVSIKGKQDLKGLNKEIYKEDV